MSAVDAAAGMIYGSTGATEDEATDLAERAVAGIAAHGYRIADAEVVAALRRVLADANALGESYHTQPGDLDRLAAWVGES